MNTEVLIKHAVNSMNARDLDSAEKYANAVIAADPENPKVYILHGNIQLKRSNIQAAFSSYKHSLKLSPCIAEAFNNNGFAYRQH